MSIVVTGATGQLGRLVVAGLLEARPAEEITVIARDPAKAADLSARGVRVHVADYSQPETLAGAFAEGDVVLLISGSEVGRRIPQHRAVIDAARAAKVARLAYTSILGGPAADFDLAREHQATEELILESGLAYTFLRNGWYTENYTAQLPVQLAHGVFGATRDGRIGAAPRADYAAAAVAVLTGAGHEGRAYELSGDPGFTLTEYAAEVSRQTGKPVAHVDLPPEAYREVLLGAGVPAPFAAILADVDVAVSKGLLAGGSGELSRLIGRPTTPLADAIAAALA
ncbi:MAG: SDR family oxidoreductase [Deltaproteobacteria bacterium]|nr:MAG: SDR family oxidoreductase [Deltaproteobacteria bacterium]